MEAGRKMGRLEGAKLVVSGGRGIGGPEGFELLERLVATLGGVVGGSLPTVDAGWVPVARQVGQSGKFVTPDLSAGVAWAPRPFQRNDKWSRKINFAMSATELLEDTLGYKPLSKLNVGAEWEQTVIPHTIVGRISVGLKGGYPTAGVSGMLLHFLKGEFLTYADEGGKFTGDEENRYYLVRLGIGL